MKIYALALAMLCGACTSTFYTEDDGTITIHAGTGGLVKPIAARYADWKAAGQKLVIDGHVISADAFEAFAYPGACYTQNAVWSPHATSNLGLYRLEGWTNLMAGSLPEPLEKWFRNDHSYYDWIGYAVVDYDELLEIWPDGACRQEDTTAVGRARVAWYADMKAARRRIERD